MSQTPSAADGCTRAGRCLPSRRAAERAARRVPHGVHLRRRRGRLRGVRRQALRRVLDVLGDEARAGHVRQGDEVRDVQRERADGVPELQHRRARALDDDGARGVLGEARPEEHCEELKFAQKRFNCFKLRDVICIIFK